MTNDSGLFVAAKQPEAEAVLGAWSWFLPSPHQLLGFSHFADCFLVDREGNVDMLDLVGGQVRRLAESVSEFEVLAALPQYQREWLRSELVTAQQGQGPGEGQCFAFRTPPVLGGQLDPENTVLWDRLAYLRGLSELFRQVLPLPLGTEVVVR